ncbi:hypothetical protein B5E87_00160 [Massilimicrobiota sp. An142]|nr:hypothetical protein B5E87_00160 [Massilimicrobiota sp. An142]
MLKVIVDMFKSIILLPIFLILLFCFSFNKKNNQIIIKELKDDILCSLSSISLLVFTLMIPFTILINL